MKIIICIELIINLFLILYFYMYMFQLNSYKFIKNIKWIKNNFKKIVIQFILLFIFTILFIINKNIFNLFSIIILFISIIYNLPKKNNKIKFKITNRIIRMFITEFLIIGIILNIFGIKNFVIIKLQIINYLSFLLCMIANFINIPIENFGRKRYINKAKNKIKEMPNLIVIGITGSYGKTSVKNFLNQILSKKYEVLVTPKNYNTTMGVVKTISEKLKPTHQIFICEMGATKIGDIKEICDIVNPNIGIITSIGPQHLESFKNINNIIKTKFELYDSVIKNNGKVFLNYDNEYIADTNKKENIFSYGLNNNKLNYNCYKINNSSNGVAFSMFDEKNNKEINFKTKLIGKHNVVNLTGVIGIANYLGISYEEIKRSIKNLKNVEHRLQLINKGNINIIDDSYNSNPVSSKFALDTLSEFNGNKIIVTPGLIELGKDENKYNFDFGRNIADVCDYIYLVGKNTTKAVEKGIESKQFNKENVFLVNSPQEAIKKIINSNIKDNVTVLLENDLPDNYNI